MAIVNVEKVGGLAGFGGARANIRSRGQIDTAALSPTEQKAVDSLFKARRKTARSKGADGFRFLISRTTDKGTETVERTEENVPPVIASCVKDEFAK